MHSTRKNVLIYQGMDPLPFRTHPDFVIECFEKESNDVSLMASGDDRSTAFRNKVFSAGSLVSLYSPHIL